MITMPCRSARAALLLESILALLLVAISVGAVAALFSESLAKIRQTRLRTRAVMLAETKLAEMQLGLADVTEGTEGDFDGRPANFAWALTIDPTDVAEMNRMTLTIRYDDGSDMFDYRLWRYFSPSLNYSYETLKDISTDPSRLQEMKDPGFKELLTLVGESQMPGGEQLIQALMAGGISEMMRLYNQIMTGQMSPEDLMLQVTMALESEQEEDEGLISVLAQRGGQGRYGPVWTDTDTAELRADSELARTDDTSEPPSEEPADRADARETDTTSDDKPDRAMSRQEAIQNIMRMMSRMAQERK